MTVKHYFLSHIFRVYFFLTTGLTGNENQRIKLGINSINFIYSFQMWRPYSNKCCQMAPTWYENEGRNVSPKFKNISLIVSILGIENVSQVIHLNVGFEHYLAFAYD